MNRLMIGTLMGFAAGVGLMSTAVGRSMRQDVKTGMRRMKGMMKEMRKRKMEADSRPEENIS